MINFDDLVLLSQKSSVQYKKCNGSLQMTNHAMPLSIKNDEFTYLHNIIIENNLQRGYEVATAFGISTLGCGLGFQKTSGKLITMDSYIEEKYNSCSAYNNIKEIYQDADGFKSIKFLINSFGLQDIIYPTVGWSPTDTAHVIRDIFDNEKLDFVFIDALHTDDAVIADLESVIPFLANKNIICVHDVHCFSRRVNNFIINKFGKDYMIPNECRYISGSESGGYNLAVINNL